MKNSKPAEAGAVAFARMVDLISTLRSENGCPWDRKQTPASIHPYILEEYHEMVQAMNEGRDKETADELGDLLFLVVFMALMLEETGKASLETILDGVTEKMRRRHPHVFGDETVRDAEQVVDNWSRIKASEPGIRDRESMLDGIPRSLPSLSRAEKLARRAARVGFDWERREDVFAKIEEELAELRTAVSDGPDEAVRAELGDVLFAVANAARLYRVDAEAALHETSDRFESRFRFIEQALRSKGKTPEEADLAEMDELWEKAKKLEAEH